VRVTTDRTSGRPGGKRTYVIRELRREVAREPVAAAPRPDPAPQPPPPRKTRGEMIAEAAYYRAQRRGFAPGDPVADWLEAEREIDAILQEDIR